MALKSVLLSFDLLRRINSFQDGIYQDVQSLKAALKPQSCSFFRYRPSIVSNHRTDLAGADALFAPWYAAYSTSHIACLFQHVKHAPNLLTKHAAYYGHVVVLEHLYGVCTPEVFNGLPLWDLAAANGHIHILNFLHSIQFMPTNIVNCHHVPATNETMRVAAASGHLSVVAWLHSHNISFDPTDAQDVAAEFGHLDVLQWLYNHGVGEITTWAMDKAAANGHLHVLAWLYDHIPSAKCTTFAMDDAARNGHLDVLEWLLAHRKEGATVASVRNAAEANHVDVLRWLLAHKISPTTSPWAMALAAQDGHLEAIQLLHEYDWPGTSRAMDKAAKHGFLGIVKWLHDHRRDGCTTSAIDDAACEGHLEVVQWLHNHRDEGCTTKALDGAIQNGHNRVAWWLIEHRNEGCSARGIEFATQRGDLGLVQWFCRHRHVEVWRREASIVVARTLDHHEIVSFLEWGQPDNCPCSKCASKHRPAFCTVQ
ncbi:Aste57867_9964 [Aphanomyces stellatus]|uniref:Aste57867_9964 protein n=1 Tax=Aphanomyces stellatus TaxID=120398 RepID=A0A485KP63_9STRA|nr:hypothetical protein As57867_009925 [Aphanomyces stellatus]VFT86842.1 Aste57867_9964 [Aphanomyces stellatus]